VRVVSQVRRNRAGPYELMRYPSALPHPSAMQKRCPRVEGLEVLYGFTQGGRKLDSERVLRPVAKREAKAESTRRQVVEDELGNFASNVP